MGASGGSNPSAEPSSADGIVFESPDGGRTSEQVSDGRAARRERNVHAVLDAVVEMFAEGDLFPTVEQVSKRSGLSVRSIYRYFTDPADLHDAAVKRHRRKSEALAHLSAIGRGPLEQRVADFVAMRLRLYEGVGAAYRATVHNASNHPRLRDELARNRQAFRVQVELHFAVELDPHSGPDRDALLAACDLLTQLDSVDLLRRYRGLTVAEAERTLAVALKALLAH